MTEVMRRPRIAAMPVVIACPGALSANPAVP